MNVLCTVTKNVCYCYRWMEVVCDAILGSLVVGLVQFLSTQLHCHQAVPDYLLLIIKKV